MNIFMYIKKNIFFRRYLNPEFSVIKLLKIGLSLAYITGIELPTGFDSC